MLVGFLGDGQNEREFVDLAQWYSKNAQPGEKLAVYMDGTVKMFVTKNAEYVVGFPKADSPVKLAEACYEQGITYVVWASREGLNPTHTAYRQLNLHENLGLKVTRTNFTATGLSLNQNWLLLMNWKMKKKKTYPRSLKRLKQLMRITTNF